MILSLSWEVAKRSSRIACRRCVSVSRAANNRNDKHIAHNPTAYWRCPMRVPISSAKRGKSGIKIGEKLTSKDFVADSELCSHTPTLGIQVSARTTANRNGTLLNRSYFIPVLKPQNVLP